MPHPLVNKLELHYFFSDASHTMDALVRHRCEAELLAIIRKVSAVTGLELRVDTEAYAEGGLRERFKLATKNQHVLTIALAIITSVATTVPGSVLTHLLTSDPERQELEKRKLQNEVVQGLLDQQKTQTEIERNQLENQRLRLEMHRLERDLNEANRVSDTVHVQDVAAYINNHNYKVLKHKSNFYKALSAYPKVTRVAFSRLSADNQEVALPETVVQADFARYIVMADTLPPLRDEEAVVEIISPVLKPGHYKWKGIYRKKGQPINLYRKDQTFKDAVIRSRLPFRNGSRIACVPDISRKLTETGEAVHTSYAFITVTATLEGSAMVETS